MSQSTAERAARELRIMGLLPHVPQGYTCPIPLTQWPELPPDVAQMLGLQADVPRSCNQPAAAPAFPEHISPADVGHPSADLELRVQELESELAELRRTNEWITHSDAQEYRAGTLTLNLSDLHCHDRGHMVDVVRCLEDKVAALVERFRPHRFICLLNGDSIPGRGIYRNQALESVLPVAEQQVAAGAWRVHELRTHIREHLPEEATEEYIIIRGQHDMSEGDDTCLPFTLTLRSMGVPARYVGSEWAFDLADAGGYWVLAEHGYGNSNYHPTSNRQLMDSYQKLIDYAQRGYTGPKRIRRLLHGHTHWLAVGISRAGVRYDTTGGCQRNDRVNLGRNQRQPGWIVYVSPPGASDILAPIEVLPELDVLRRDLDDPLLVERNRGEASRCLKAWNGWAQEAGILATAQQEDAA